jgi:exosortase D (VPLPA-CTERM-specific)
MSKKKLFPVTLETGLTVFVGVVLLWLYWPVLTRLFNDLTVNEDYSYGLLLPLVSLYLIYLKWPQISSQSWQPSWLGLIIVSLGFFCYIFGELVAIYYIAPVSFVIVLAGFAVVLGGWRLLRLLIFPLFLLFLMIPLPSLLTKQMTLPLQLLSSWLAAHFLQFAGFPLVRQGNVIDLGVRQLQVVDACSGLRYILSLSALGLIFCYFYQRRLWKAMLLIISLVPLAILANALRVAAMGVLPALQEGFLHSFSGWLIFVFCFGFLGLLNWLLNYVQPPVAPVASEANILHPTPDPGVAAKKPTYYLLAMLALVIFAYPVTHRLSEPSPVPLLQNFDHFPMEIQAWKGRRGFLDKAVAEVVGADDYLEAVYDRPEGKSISLWIAYFESQGKDVRRRIHSPLLCLSGAGWRFLESQIIDVAPGLPVRYLLMERHGAKQVVFYWYLQRGRWYASEYPKYLFMGIDGLLKRRNDGAIVRLITPVEGNHIQDAKERLANFTHLLIPVLSQFIPN